MQTIITLLAPLARPHAYLDPGSGSILIQLLAAAALGAAFAARIYWKKIKAFFSGKKNPEEKPVEETKIEEPIKEKAKKR